MKKEEKKCPFCGSSKVINTGRKRRVGFLGPNHEFPAEKNVYKCENENCGRTFEEG